MSSMKHINMCQDGMLTYVTYSSHTLYASVASAEPADSGPFY